MNMLISGRPIEVATRTQLSYIKFVPYTINQKEITQKITETKAEPGDVNARHQLVKTTSPTTVPNRAPSKYKASYCAGFKDINGRLTINNESISFRESKPKDTRRSSWFGLFKSEPNVMQNEVEKCRAVINIKDIADCKVMSFPVPCSQHAENVNILQLTLFNHGDLLLGPELDEVVSEMQKKRTPYVSVFFNVKISTHEEKIKPDEALKTLLEIRKRVKELISIQEVQESEIETKLPYFDFITENFDNKYHKNLQETKQFMNQITKRNVLVVPQDVKNLSIEKPLISKKDSMDTKSTCDSLSPPLFLRPKPTFMPTMLDKSTIVTDEQFAYIVSSVPGLYQSFDWKLLYANSLHGTSYNNLMRRSKHASHFLLIIRDTCDNILGAYGSDQLRLSDLYYGTGETFIFSFWKSQELSVFEWSKKNRLFMFVNEDGMMFGTGPFYGLWVGSDLTRGRTHPCETFNNRPLSDSTDFEIARIEIWSIVDPFTKI